MRVLVVMVFLRAVLLATSFLDGSVLILKTQEKEQDLYSSETHFVCMRYCARHAVQSRTLLSSRAKTPDTSSFDLGNGYGRLIVQQQIWGK